MSVNVKLGESASGNKPFPKLMKDGGGTVVLFSEHEKGTVVFSSNSVYFVSEHRGDWKQEAFTEFNRTVELQNS